MDGFSFATLAKELKDVEEEGITFEDKQLTWDTADDVKDVVDALVNNKVVHYLKLDGNTLGIDAAAAIGKALEQHPEFRKALWKNMFTRRLKTEIPQALKHLGSGLMVAKAHLTVLDLSDNALGPNGMVGLEDLLRSPVCYSLKELHLNNCGLGIYGGGMLSKALLDCHSVSSAAGTPLQLKVFVTGRNRLEDAGAKEIAKIFETLRTLEEISMPQNYINPAGIGALAESFKKNPNLRVLNLNDNTVRGDGAAVLADSFSFTPNLQEINLGDCLIKSAGASSLAAALEENHRELISVDLSFNDMTTDGGLDFVGAMQNKPHLEKLILDGNMFGSDGMECIREAMQGAANPDALDEMEEDVGDGDDDDVGDGDGEYDDDGECYDDDDVDTNHADDTTEEADESEDYLGEFDDVAEQTAYTTTTAFTTKMFNANDFSFASVQSTAPWTPETEQTASAVVDTLESFCLSQKPITLQNFESLKEKVTLDGLTDIFNKFTGDNYLLVLIFTTLKCAHLSQSSDDALKLAIALYKVAIAHAVEIKQERRVLNYLLIQLGLLRSEKKFQTPYNQESCRYALRETLGKEEVASTHMRNAFNVFLKQLDA